MKYLLNISEVTSFTRFINESLGFSNQVKEYSDIVKTEAISELHKYQNFNFRSGFTNYNRDILIKPFTKVSKETQVKFPINSILLKFRISAVNTNEFSKYSAYYQQNYDKYELSKSSGKANIVIYCKLVISKHSEQLDLEMLEDQLTRILNHELLHAYQDYRNPNFLKDQRWADLYSAAKLDPIFSKSPALIALFELLYVTSDSEIWAISAEKEKYDSLDQLREDYYYFWARAAMEFDPDEWFELIESEVSNTQILNNFGKYFIQLYRRVTPIELSPLDPKILNISNLNLLDSLNVFAQKLQSQGKKLFRNLARKINN